MCREIIRELSQRESLIVSAFAVSWRRRASIAASLPGSVSSRQRPMPARPLHWCWSRSQFPPGEWFLKDHDVVHGTNFVVPPMLRSARVVSVHDLTPLHFPELCNPATLIYPEAIRRAVRSGAWVHTDSTFIAEEVVEAFGADPERVRTVYLGVPPFPPAGSAGSADSTDPEARGRLRVVDEESGRELEPARRYIVSVGTAEPRKDLCGLVEAFSLIAEERDDVDLVLAGPRGWGSEQLDSSIRASRFASRIFRTGWVDDELLAGLIGRASLLAYPSLYEGFGLPPLQAMSVGVPVVATSSGSIPEILGDAAVLVGPRDKEALGEALAGVLDSKERRDDLVGKGFRRAGEFSWEKCAEGLDALYHDAAKSVVRR
jgi:glycosyltransferase involved in cell wall biosynthesis